jgi:hypothetical protein
MARAPDLVAMASGDHRRHLALEATHRP